MPAPSAKPVHEARRIPETHPIRVILIGAGGNGSAMLTHLARIHTALARGFFHPAGLQVTVVDPDTVSEANLGRQAFCAADLGLPKAEALVQRINLFYGLRWEASVSRFNTNVRHHTDVPLVITCVDTTAARVQIHKVISRWRSYWLDLGNGPDFGQAILGETEGDFMGNGTGTRANRLPHLFDVCPHMRKVRDKDTGPSCSLVEALERQDLFINTTLASHAGALLWQLFRHRVLTHHGVFLNLRTGRTAPVEIKA